MHKGSLDSLPLAYDGKILGWRLPPLPPQPPKFLRPSINMIFYYIQFFFKNFSLWTNLGSEEVRKIEIVWFIRVHLLKWKLNRRSSDKPYFIIGSTVRPRVTLSKCILKYRVTQKPCNFFFYRNQFITVQLRGERMPYVYLEKFWTPQKSVSAGSMHRGAV